MMVFRGLCRVALVTCCVLQWQLTCGRKIATCDSVCRNLQVPDGCKYAPNTNTREEVIVITNGTSDIRTWKWDTITMVVSAYFSSVRSTGLTACYAHSVGKRYGLRELVPADIARLLSDTDSVKQEYADMILTYQTLLMADHMVFDLLQFFLNLNSVPSHNTSFALSKMAEVLSYAAQRVKASHNREVYCIVPWQPPCESECQDIKTLLSACDVLLMSPDSYMPLAPADQRCLAQATVPISRFLYGIDRYISLKAKPDAARSVVAGIPWHGYVYKCDQPISDDKCVIHKPVGEACFSNDNRQRLPLTNIHSLSTSKAEHFKMDVITKGIYYNMNSTSQLWFENFTTLLLKYQLVQDLRLKGLSLWYGEDMAMKVGQTDFVENSWSFLTHHVLHTIVYRPDPVSHYYADTVAGVAVGCLLLGTILGVTFTCIAFQRERFRKLSRPFRLDEDESAYRDDEGL